MRSTISLKMVQKLRSDIEIREPRTEMEFEQYYDLRWRMLRKPWHQPQGSEKDEFEDSGIHIAAFLNGKIIGCGRGHFISSRQAQIRWMAVEDEYQGQSLGSRILKVLEEQLFKAGTTEIILKAREKAVNLYRKQGYEIFDEGELMFGEIRHYWMRK